jgi:hypothetical protein
MTTNEKITKKSHAHTIYKLADGSRVPGCTTITGVMDKSRALVPWANRLGLQGIDSTKYVDETAQIGSLAHLMIANYITETPGDYADNTANQIAAAGKCFAKFEQWIAARSLTPKDFALSEAALVSEKYRFGGTVDIGCMLGGKATLIDIKTSKAIYDEQLTQVAGGYALLCEENGFKLDQIIILRIGRNDEEGTFDERLVSPEEAGLHIQRFHICRQLYEINKKINKQ